MGPGYIGSAFQFLDAAAVVLAIVLIIVLGRVVGLW